MRISRSEVLHIARLARIKLTEAETAAFEGEFSAILAFVAKLEEAATMDVEPLTGGHALLNVMRDDGASLLRNTEVGPSLIDAAPRKRDGYVEVKAVFKRE